MSLNMGRDTGMGPEREQNLLGKVKRNEIKIRTLGIRSSLHCSCDNCSNSSFGQCTPVVSYEELSLRAQKLNNKGAPHVCGM